MYGFDDAGEPLTDEALIAEITAYRKAIRDAAMRKVGVIAGEGRRLEFTSSNVGLAQSALRDLLRIARGRGLPIGGSPNSAIAVEIG